MCLCPSTLLAVVLCREELSICSGEQVSKVYSDVKRYYLLEFSKLHFAVKTGRHRYGKGICGIKYIDTPKRQG